MPSRIRATPDQLALAEKFIHNIDKAKPEVIIQVEVLEARTDRMRDLGILPGTISRHRHQSESTASNNNNGSNNSNNGAPGTVTLNQLTHLTQNDLVLYPSPRHCELPADRFQYAGHSKPGSSFPGRPAGKIEYWRPRARGNRQLPSRSRCGFDQQRGFRESSC